MSERKNILLVDDDFFSIILLKEYLKNMNVVIHAVKNGKEAVDFWKNNNKTDLIISDILMPVMDGISVINKIRKENNTVKFIAQTAFATQEKIDEIISAGFNAVILKPYKKEDFVELVERILSKQEVAS
ncbi:MAG: response regulator [Chlorobi bacterium]|nr:response regulator [Chlorobiota bacterium]